MLNWQTNDRDRGEIAHEGAFTYQAWHWVCEIRWPRPVALHRLAMNHRGDIEIMKAICQSHADHSVIVSRYSTPRASSQSKRKPSKHCHHTIPKESIV